MKKDLSDESSYESMSRKRSHKSKPGSVTKRAEANDHSYLCNQNNEPSSRSFNFAKIEEKAMKMLQSIRLNEQASVVSNDKPPGRASPVPGVSDQNTPLLPVKKKRGRKPGSKSVHFPYSRFPINISRKIYYIPTLKHPERFPHLIHFTDDDDPTYLRNTSRDVMLSSTLPFQETPEYLELKETYYRLNSSNARERYSLLPYSMGKCMPR